MRWVRVQANLPDHPKFAHLAVDDLGVWFLCLLWCGRQDRDCISLTVLHSVGGDAATARRFVTAGLFEKNGSREWVLHDFAQWQGVKDLAEWRAREPAIGLQGLPPADRPAYTPADARAHARARLRPRAASGQDESGRDSHRARGRASERGVSEPDNPVDRRIERTLRGER